MTTRRAEAGVTLIEMLAALAVTAMIGLAGFTLLDGVATRDIQLSGRIDSINARDRAFRLLALDAVQARTALLSENDGLQLAVSKLSVVWRADDRGVTRAIQWPDGRVVTQQILPDRARIELHPSTSKAIILVLPEADVGRVVALPEVISQ